MAPPGNQAANGENKPQPLVFGAVKPVHSTHYIINDFIFLSLTIVLFGIGDIHDFQHRNPLNVNKLVQNKALYNRRNYHINIISLSNICWVAFDEPTIMSSTPFWAHSEVQE